MPEKKKSGIVWIQTLTSCPPDLLLE